MLCNATLQNNINNPCYERQLPQEERAESIMREALLWGHVAGPILGGCLVWGRSGPSMVFSRAVLSACLASLLVPAAWRGPSHVALRLFQGLCTVSRRADFITAISKRFAMTWTRFCVAHVKHDVADIKHSRENHYDILFCRAQPCLLLTCSLWPGLRAIIEAGTSVVMQVYSGLRIRSFKW